MLKNFHWWYRRSRSGPVVRTSAAAEAGMRQEWRKAECTVGFNRRGPHSVSPLFVSFDVYVFTSHFLCVFHQHTGPVVFRVLSVIDAICLAHAVSLSYPLGFQSESSLFTLLKLKRYKMIFFLLHPFFTLTSFSPGRWHLFRGYLSGCKCINEFSMSFASGFDELPHP